MTSQSEPVASVGQWHDALPADAVPPGAIHPFEVAGVALVVLRHGGDYVVMDRWCPHQGGDMAQGRVVAKTLKCPLHGYMFSLDNGRGLNCRGYNARLHEVQVVDGTLQVRLRP